MAVTPSIVVDEMEQENLAEHLFYGKKMYIKAIRPSTSVAHHCFKRNTLVDANKDDRKVHWTSAVL